MAETDSFIRFFLDCKIRFKYWNESKIQNYQLKNAQNIVRYAIEKAPFFNDFYQGYNLKDVWSLPTINKKIMMDNLSNYNTIGFTKQELLDFTNRIEKEKNYNERLNGYNVALSSGTSGSKGIVITSQAEEKYLQAAFFSRFNFPFVLRLKWAFLLRVTTPAFQVKKFGQQLTHISLQLTHEKIREKLQKFKPNVLSSPPSMLKILAKDIQQNQLDIKPKRIVSYGEVLEPETKREIEEIFKTNVHQIYQGSEGSFGITCKNNSLHINEDLIKLQLLNKDGTFTEPGESCFKLIVTDLHKKSQPIIRFELNDIIKISPLKCKCGSSFRVIEQIMGRADDLFWSKRKNSEELQYIFPDYIRRAIITSSDYIDEYQAIQESYNRILVRLKLKSKISNKEQIIKIIQTNISKIFLEHDCIKPEIIVKFESPKRNPISNKLIRIQSNLKTKDYN